MEHCCKIGPFISRVYTSLDKIEVSSVILLTEIAFYVKKHSCGFEKVNRGIIACNPWNISAIEFSGTGVVHLQNLYHKNEHM